MNFSDSISILISQILDNSVLAWALIACGIAQLSKLGVEMISYRRWRPSVLLETGGMPSSHSAFVTGTAAGVGLENGFNHSSFAIAATLAFVVMYDAAGIRRAAGDTSKKVNLLTEKILPKSSNDLLKETLGHSRFEVLIGSLVGPLIAMPGIEFIGSPLHALEALVKVLG